MKKILLIEDNVNNHMLISRFLSKDGYEVLSCDSASESYKLIDKHQFELVITDYGALTHIKCYRR